MSAQNIISAFDGKGVFGAKRLRFDRIPVIDFGPFFQDDRTAMLETARRLRDVCIQIGFFYVTNHGVSAAMIGRVLRETKRFFALPLDQKMAYDIARIGRHRGYVPIGALSADPNAQTDQQEGYEIALELPEDDPDYRAGSYIYGPNVWPEEVPAFRDEIYAYFEEMLRLGRVLFHGFALSLGLPEDYFADKIDKPMAQLRLVRYPPQEESEIDADEIGVGAHTDYECFTILWQSDVGLQVQNPCGEWIEAPPVADTFVINIGDMMQRWTNDLFASTPHRVINTSEEERYSLPFFFGANYNTVVRPLEVCAGPDNPPRYPPTKCGYWTENMHTYSYAYRWKDRGKLPDPELPKAE